MNRNRDRRSFRQILPLSRKAKALSAYLGLVIVLSGCAPSPMSHLNSQPFEPLFKVNIEQSAWLAVDSCSSGIHAIAELELELQGDPESELRPLALVGPVPVSLVYNSGIIYPPSMGAVEGPICQPSAQMAFRGEEQGYESKQTVCTYTYRVQFNLRRLPDPQDEIYLRYGGRSFLLAVR